MGVDKDKGRAGNKKMLVLLNNQPCSPLHIKWLSNNF